MPNNIIKSFSDQANKTEDEVERLWKKAENIASEKFSKDDEEFYPMVVGILKKMLGLDEEMTVGSIGLDSGVPAGGPGMGVRIKTKKDKKAKRKKGKLLTFREFLEL